MSHGSNGHIIQIGHISDRVPWLLCAPHGCIGCMADNIHTVILATGEKKGCGPTPLCVSGTFGSADLLKMPPNSLLATYLELLFTDVNKCLYTFEPPCSRECWTH